MRLKVNTGWLTGRLRGPYLFAVLFLFLALIANMVVNATVIERQREGIRFYEERVRALGRHRGSAAVRGASLAGDIETFEKHLPQGKGLTKVIADVFGAARKNGLDIPSGDYSPETVKEADFSRYTIFFPVEGRYPQIKKFIYDLETLKHPISIEEIVFSKKKGGRAIELKIRLSAYFRGSF